MDGVHERPEMRLSQPQREQPAQHPSLLALGIPSAPSLAGDDEHRARTRFLQGPQARQQMIMSGQAVEAMKIDHRIKRTAALPEPAQLPPGQLPCGRGGHGRQGRPARADGRSGGG